jgi:hypothetical protein
MWVVELVAQFTPGRWRGKRPWCSHGEIIQIVDRRFVRATDRAAVDALAAIKIVPRQAVGIEKLRSAGIDRQKRVWRGG